MSPPLRKPNVSERSQQIHQNLAVAFPRTAVEILATEHPDLGSIDLRDQMDDSTLKGLYICFRDKATLQSLQSSYFC
jgi:hypothetical protein